MAYDYGTNTLGIRNPFKVEGAFRTVAGVSIALLGFYNLFSVTTTLAENQQLAWIKAGMGLLFLVWGLKASGTGLFQTFKYFVGRSVPTSLAYNRNPSEQDNAKEEAKVTPYEASDIESMLMGRKNTTFTEPLGWLARLIHSILPKLILMPYPIRNLVQELGGLLASLIVALVAFGLAFFISTSGLIGSAGDLILPALSALLLIYITLSWRSSAKALNASHNQALRAKSAAGIAKVLALAILLPAVAGYGISQLSGDEVEFVNSVIQVVFPFHAWGNLFILFAMISVILLVVGLLAVNRFKLAQPTTDVVEYRDNMQESVHPNELFINIENIVLANRRYKEIPNRVYQAFDPELQEQSQGKGSFRGKLLIETQPEYQEISYSSLFKSVRIGATALGQLLTVAAAVLAYLTVLKGYTLADFIAHYGGFILNNQDAGRDFGELLSGFLTFFFGFLAVFYGAKIITNAVHLFWSEMQFNSLLLWMKTEGTYTESKISTGMAIHDSTRSENVVVRSSITPWLLSSRITTSTFATSGMRNLEMPRYILSLQKNEDEMNKIVGEIKHFLRDRESIASISNEKDLGNAETIYQVNQAARSNSSQVDPQVDRIEAGAAVKQIENESSEDIG